MYGEPVLVMADYTISYIISKMRNQVNSLTLVMPKFSNHSCSATASKSFLNWFMAFGFGVQPQDFEWPPQGLPKKKKHFGRCHSM